MIQKEREGRYYEGKTVQVIPHVTDEIKAAIHRLASDDVDVVITEIGGTVGDIEGLPFLEAIRQFALDVGRENCLYIHLTLVPYLKAAGELKTKPTQHSVGCLRQIGIQPDVLICRTEHPIAADDKDKIALFCNVERKAVIEERDKQFSIYEVPLCLVNHGLDEILVKRLRLKASPLDLTDWRDMVERIKHPKHEVRIAVVGKYMKHPRRLQVGLRGARPRRDRQSHARAGRARRGRGGRQPRGRGDPGRRRRHPRPGRVRHARDRGQDRGDPLRADPARSRIFGICLGMQCAVVEFARDVLGLEDANSTEFDQTTDHPVIWLMEEQQSVRERGGTMRLGSWPCVLAPGQPGPRGVSASDLIHERHRHRYEFNNAYRKAFQEHGLVATGISPDGTIVEIMERRDHPWFLAVQFHPEFKSKPTKAHPLFRDFVAAALRQRETQPGRVGAMSR